MNRVTTIHEHNFEHYFDVAKKACNFYSRNVKILNRQDKEDLLQDTLEKFFRVIDKYDPNKASVNTFINVIAKSVMLNRIKAKRKKSSNESSMSAFRHNFSFSGRDYGSESYSLEELLSDNVDLIESWELFYDILYNCGLDSREKDLAAMLLDGYKQADIASDQGYTRARICQLVRGLRKKCEVLLEDQN